MQDPQPHKTNEPDRRRALSDQEQAQPEPASPPREEAKPSDTPPEYKTWRTGP